MFGIPDEVMFIFLLSIISLILILIIVNSYRREKMCPTCEDGIEMDRSIVYNPYLRPVSRCINNITDSTIAETRDPDNISNYFSTKREYDHQYLTS